MLDVMRKDDESLGHPLMFEKEVRERDKACAYCDVQMVEKRPRGGSRRTVATWEHIINDATIVTRENRYILGHQWHPYRITIG